MRQDITYIAGLARQVRVQPFGTYVAPSTTRALTPAEQAYVVQRYGTPQVRGRLATVSENHPDVTIKSLAAELRCSEGTIARVLKRARENERRTRGRRRG